MRGHRRYMLRFDCWFRDDWSEERALENDVRDALEEENGAPVMSTREALEIAAEVSSV